MGVTDLRATGKTLVMGVLNITPDSFFEPSTVTSPEDALERAHEMMADGADLLDIGGESSRPGAEPVGLDLELARVMPVLEALEPLDCPISIDTFRAETARQALGQGAVMVNDITALRGDAGMAGVIAEAGAECVLMHMQGTPKTMQDEPRYDDVIDDICAFFEARIAYAEGEGLCRDRLWLDPGFGFGKSVGQNLLMLRRLEEFKRFGLPLLIGTSNKSTIGAVLGLPVDDRTEGTAATVAIAIGNGVDCVRVHDVKTMARVTKMCDAALGKVDYD